MKNVFDRTIRCCKKYKFDAFVRVNADRPFFDFNLMNKMIKIYSKNNYDIVTNQSPRLCPKGLGCEISNVKIFYNINQNKLRKSEKEHIFNFFYKNKKKYKVFNFVDKIYRSKTKLNLSIDTKKHLIRTKKIYNYYNNNVYVLTKKILYKFGNSLKWKYY